MDLGSDESTMIAQPITSPTQSFQPQEIEEESIEDMPFLKSEVAEEVSSTEEEVNMESIMLEEQQATFNFDPSAMSRVEEPKEEFTSVESKIEEEPKEERIVHYLEDDLEEEVTVVDNSTETTTEEISKEEHQELYAEREERIKELSLKLRTPFGLSELENEPAYIRRQIKLEDTPHSSESEVSRFTLNEEEGQDGKSSNSIKGNNSFLHDNVD